MFLSQWSDAPFVIFNLKGATESRIWEHMVWNDERKRSRHSGGVSLLLEKNSEAEKPAAKSLMVEGVKM